MCTIGFDVNNKWINSFKSEAFASCVYIVFCDFFIVSVFYDCSNQRYLNVTLRCDWFLKSQLFVPMLQYKEPSDWSVLWGHLSINGWQLVQRSCFSVVALLLWSDMVCRWPVFCTKHRDKCHCKVICSIVRQLLL